MAAVRDRIAALRLPIDQAAALLAIVALWLATHPYGGIVHDGRLYTIQAMRAAGNAAISNDLFLKFGSQDSFTLFSALYAPLITATNPALAHMAGTLLGGVCWVIALAFLASAAFPSRQLWLAAVIGAVALDSRYGGLGTLRYGETFLTPRLLTEALVMIALGFALRGRAVLAWAALSLGVLLHPLMAVLSGGALVLYYARGRKWIWLAGLGAAAAGGALAVAGVEPFGRMLQRFDPEWFRIIYHRCRLVFLTQWRWNDIVQIAAIFAVLGTAAATAERRLRAMILAILAAALLSLLVSFVGSDLAKNVLIADLQVWRTLWLVSLFANLCLGPLVLQLPKGGHAREFLTIAFAAGIAGPLLGLPTFTAPGIALLGCAALVLEANSGRRLSRPLRLPLRAVIVLLLAVDGVMIWVRLHDDHLLQRVGDAALAGAIILAFFAARRLRPRVALAGLAVLACGLAVAGFDHRSNWQAFAESPEIPHDLKTFVGPSRNIYWEASPELLWFKFGTANYYSCAQGAGALFYRDTAVVYDRRTRALGPLRTRDVAGRLDPACGFPGKPRPSAAPTRASIARVCQQLPDLDELVLMEAAPDVAGRKWRPPVPKEMPSFEDPRGHDTIREFYAYSCAQFRSPPATMQVRSTSEGKDHLYSGVLQSIAVHSGDVSG